MVEGKPKRPDYGFRVHGATRFFLETKKPSLNLKDDPSPAYQLRRYGWSGNLPVSVLSDFEEFTIYDCRIQPRRFDSAEPVASALLHLPGLCRQLGQALRLVQSRSGRGTAPCAIGRRREDPRRAHR